MARAFGRILASIWDDEDFTDLDEGPQRLYMFLLSQSNLNHAGLLPLTLRRWARKAKNLTAAQLEDQLEALERARFVVLDYDTEELLVRTLVRNDSVYKQPRVMGAMVADAKEIASRVLRAALLAEIDRLPLDELSDAPGPRNAPSIRIQVDAHIAELRDAFGNPTPPRPPRRPLSEPVPVPGPEDLSEPPADGDGEPLPEDLPEGDAQGYPQGSTRVDASPRARTYPQPLPVSPAPSPIPDPLDALAARDAEPAALFGAPDAEAQKADAGKPRGKRQAKAADPETEARNRLAVEITRSWWDGCQPKPSGKFVGRQQIVCGLLEAEHAPDDIAEALRRCGFSMTRASAELQLKRLAEERERESATVLPFQRPATSDLGGDEHMQRFLARQAARRAQ